MHLAVKLDGKRLEGKHDNKTEQEAREECERRRKKIERHALDSLHLLYAFPFDWTCCFIVQFKLQCSNAVDACHFSHVSLLPETAFLSLAFAVVLVISRVFLFGVHYNIYSHRYLMLVRAISSCHEPFYTFLFLFFSFGVNFHHCYGIISFFRLLHSKRLLTHS